MTESLHEMAKRMCNGRKCTGCFVHEQTGAHEDCGTCVVNRLADPDASTVDAQLDALRAWAAANPVRTYRTDYFERIPNAARNSNGYPCPFVWEVYDIPDGRTKAVDRFGEWDAPLGTWGEKGDT